jgi:hypothetical protein
MDYVIDGLFQIVLFIALLRPFTLLVRAHSRLKYVAIEPFHSRLWRKGIFARPIHAALHGVRHVFRRQRGLPSIDVERCFAYDVNNSDP